MTTVLVLITLLSVLTAVVAVGVAWRTVAAERRRADARVAALAASGQTPDAPFELVLSDAGEPSTDARMLFGDAAVPREPEGPPRRLIAAAAVAVAAIGLVTIAWIAGHRNAPVQAVAQATAASLELVSLAHSRTTDTLTVTGLVRNPAQAVPVEDVSVVVFFFDPAGRFLSSARAPLDFRKLAPGDESPFTVAVSTPAGLGRYRVSFRRTEGGIVPHVDRRRTPAAVSASSTGRASL
jgi:hypothetical protein